MDSSIKLFFSQIIGPAGTGKTESVKALGHQLGRFVLVFNCDETFDFQVRNFFTCVKSLSFPCQSQPQGKQAFPSAQAAAEPSTHADACFTSSLKVNR